MRSFFPAVTLAIGLHVFLLTRGTNWLSRESPNPPVKRPVTMTLTYLKPEKKQIAPVVKAVKTAPNPLIRPLVPPHPKPKEIPKPIIRTKPKATAKKKSVPRHPVPVPKKRHEKKRSKPIAAVVKPSRKVVPIPPRPVPYEEPVKDKIVEEQLSDMPGPLPENAEPVPPDQETQPAVPAVVELARPLYKVNPRPSYPKIARRRGYEGIVVLNVQVLKTGQVGDISVLRSSGHRRLDRAALNAVRKWRFEPGTRNGIPVAMTVKVPIHFRLK